MSAEKVRNAMNAVIEDRVNSAVGADKVRNALNGIIDDRAKELFESVRDEINEKLREASELIPDVQVEVDMKPIAQALSVLIKGMKEAEERREKMDKAILAAFDALTKQLKANSESKIIGKIDPTGKITIERTKG